MTESSKRKSFACATGALEKKATDIVLLRMKGIVFYADYFLICSGNSDRQVQAIAQSIETALENQGHRVLGIEGMSQGRWVLMDCGEVIVHIFQDSVRKFYDLEGLWIEAPRVDIENETTAKRVKTPRRKSTREKGNHRLPRT
jgi:ribosome-associated protein